jgi:hypothetical protein
MISVLPGQSFEFRNPKTPIDLEDIIEDVSRLIRGASPFVDSIEFLNKTKHGTVDIAFKEQKIQVIFRNPKDEEFDLNELDDSVTPIQITGR